MSIEAVLAPIAEQLSNLIVIVAKAERAGSGIRNLSKYSETIKKACDNLVSIGCVTHPTHIIVASIQPPLYLRGPVSSSTLLA